MHRVYLSSLVCLASLACTVSNPYEGETFASVSTTMSAVTETQGDGDGDSMTSGDGDGDPATTTSGDGDGDPTTTTSTSGDGDGDPTTTTTGDGDGDPTTTGDGDGDPDPTTTGDGDGDPPPACDRFRHVYHLLSDTWSSTPLDQVWTGANAPPCSIEMLGSTYIVPWDQLLVWGDDGMFYRRVGGAWQAPESINQRWPVVANLEIRAVHNVPAINGNAYASLQIQTTDQVHTYEMYEDANTVFVQSVMANNWADPGPPSLDNPTKWMAALYDVEAFGNEPTWWEVYLYPEGLNTLYRNVGIFVWENWPVNQSEMFDDAPNNIDPNNFECGWGNLDVNRVYVVGQ